MDNTLDVWLNHSRYVYDRVSISRLLVILLTALILLYPRLASAKGELALVGVNTGLWWVDRAGEGSTDNFYPVANAGIDPKELTIVGDRLFFVAQGIGVPLSDGSAPDGYSGPTVFVTDDPASDARPIWPTAGTIFTWGPAHALIGFNDALYFSTSALSSYQPGKFHKYGMSIENAGTGEMQISGQKTIGNAMYASGISIKAGYCCEVEPYVIDTNGVRLLKNLAYHLTSNDPWPSDPNGFTGLADDLVVFAATNVQIDFDAGLNQEVNTGVGRELFRTDGTGDGTVVIKDIVVGSDGSSPEHLTRFGDNVVFSTDDGINGRELWVTDGTDDSTHLIIDLNSAGDTEFGELIEYNDVLLFAADNTDDGVMHLWLTDASTAGTSQLNDDGLINPKGFVEFNSMVYFSAQDSSGDRELWVTDGSAAGTRRLIDINAGANSASPAHLTVFNDQLFFAADDGVHGSELWKSDGQASGTMLVADLHAGVNGSNPASLTVHGDTLVMAANDSLTERKLWRYTPLSALDGLGLSISAAPLSFSHVGEQITLQFDVNNAAGLPLTDVTVVDSRIGRVCSVGDLWTGVSARCTAVYFVTEDDLATGKILFDATATSAETAGVRQSVTVTGASGSALTVAAVSTPSTFTNAYDAVTINVTVTNTSGSEMTNVAVDEPGLGGICAVGSLWTGVSVTCTAVYFVTPGDVDAGRVDFTFSVHSEQSGGTVTEMLTLFSQLDTSGLSASMTSTPLTFSKAGDLLTLTMTVNNDSGVMQSNIVLRNLLLSQPFCDAGSLWTGYSAVCTGLYTVTDSDVATGKINFVVTATSDQVTAPVQASLTVTK